MPWFGSIKTWITIGGLLAIALAFFFVWKYYTDTQNRLLKQEKYIAQLEVSNATYAQYVEDLRKNFEVQIDVINDFWRQMIEIEVPEGKIIASFEKHKLDELQQDPQVLEGLINAQQADIKECMESAANGTKPRRENAVCGE